MIEVTENLQDAINKADNGEVLIVHPGAWTGNITIARSNISLIGKTQDVEAHSVRFKDVHDVSIKNFTFAPTKQILCWENNCCDIILENLRFQDTEKSILFYWGTNIVIRRIISRNFSKRCVEVNACNHVKIEDCYADSMLNQTKPFANGFLISSCHHVQVKNCTAVNLSYPVGKYWQGDGFVIEGGSSDVTLENCYGENSDDSIFDIKGDEVMLINCIGRNAKRIFRAWGECEMINCTAIEAKKRGDGMSSGGLWTRGNPKLTNMRFVDCENDIIKEDGGTVTIL